MPIGLGWFLWFLRRRFSSKTADVQRLPPLRSRPRERSLASAARPAAPRGRGAREEARSAQWTEETDEAEDRRNTSSYFQERHRKPLVPAPFCFQISALSFKEQQQQQQQGGGGVVVVVVLRLLQLLQLLLVC